MLEGQNKKKIHTQDPKILGTNTQIQSLWCSGAQELSIPTFYTLKTLLY